MADVARSVVPCAACAADAGLRASGTGGDGALRSTWRCIRRVWQIARRLSSLGWACKHVVALCNSAFILV